MTNTRGTIILTLAAAGILAGVLPSSVWAPVSALYLVAVYRRAVPVDA